MIPPPTSPPHGEATAPAILSSEWAIPVDAAAAPAILWSALAIPVDAAAAPAILSSAWEIPVDYQIKAGGFGFLAGSNLTIFNAHGELAFRVHGQSGHRRVRVLEDAAGHTLFTVVHRDGEWQGFRGKSLVGDDLVFTAKKVLHSVFMSEIEVDLSGAKLDDPKPSFRLKGSPFNKSCTIYKEDVAVAQTNLLYKLRKIIYSRAKFRLTIFPGYDHALVIAMLATFLA